ncbi:carbohydrate ABC transporter permease [Aliiroseovarius crassostreae]|uniref:carbohydrate ABC transporter permease n=1 Tax=Aliiroseovarius crassostreae TaxID=154981 RepID=UPI003C7EA4D9
MAMAGQKSRLSLVVNGAAALLVLLWIIPTVGLLVSSFRDRDAISVSGWWSALSASEQVVMVRAPAPDQAVEKDGVWTVSGNVFGGQGGTLTAFGITSKEPAAFKVGDSATHKRGHQITVQENGDFSVVYPEKPDGKRGQRIFALASSPPSGTFDNYTQVLFAEGMGKSFLNTFTVTIPATVIPVLIAAFAAYALAWMELPGRALLIAGIVGLLVVPLQVAFIPLLKLHNGIGLGKDYLGIWLAHTGFGMPLAIYLLRNYMVGLPGEIIESARVDGATDFEIFRTIILPLSFPALASFSIFQFLWVWNDLLVAKVFLGTSEEQLVMTGRIVEMMGSLGGDWGLLSASAFISIAVPIAVFFSLQRYLVRGLLAGSVKGG